ncbi:AglZ/HisF2 family acetamidino modification protein [Massilia cavernae]|uniref:imidazole glycerol-phosphate synthase n=1 Tax=Massilia cavernae TaxID=2320864 RepID=A0A418Y6I9_9BURK|nr:AglZ/HisF2 family acetamidino modification protein [Massilia cavernae]RJG23672.1 imidazole glycerol phosphate synthase cyclase subunit [Massilia cavernae]
MLRPRFIPCLLIRDKGLVKTVKFGASKYVGDPINAVKIFNEKEADELIVLDIDASVTGAAPDFAVIKKLAAECRMPLCYGGGVKTVAQAKTIIGLGVEKVALSSAALANPELITAIAAEIGSQSVVVVLDVKKSLFGKYEVYTHHGKKATGKSPVELARAAERLGAGEIVINSIDLDGQMKGYDLDLAKKVREAVALPMSVLGGAGSLADIGKLIRTCGVVGAAAGSMFVFKGSYRAVLINYPTVAERDGMISSALNVE